MKRNLILLLGLVSWFPTLRFCLAASTDPAVLRSYPLTNDTEYVRVSKALFDRVEIRSVTITNSDTRQFTLTPEFTTVFLLTTEEVARMNQALTNALHAYRTVQGRHFQALDSEIVFEKALGELPYPTGTFRFSLKPFPEAAAMIRETLRSNVLDILGSQRANYFWQHGEMFLNGEMNTTNHARIAGWTHHFSVLTRKPGPLVDLTVTYSGGSHGRPYGKSLDAYAPEPLKPVLTRWREWLANNPDTFAWTATASEHPVVELPPGYSPAAWDDASEHVDLPKAVVRTMKVPGLTDEENISPEAIAVLALTTNEVTAITRLYHEMKGRLEQMERGHLIRPDPTKPGFTLRAFPEQAAALKEEWLAGLGKLVGGTRAEILDGFIRTRESPFWQMARHGLDKFARRMPGESDHRWFDRGQFEVRIDFETVPGPIGLEIRRIQYESDRPEKGTMGGPRLPIPGRFRHLLTPDMLKTLRVL